MSTYAKIKNSKTYDVRIQKEAVPQSKANEMGLVLKWQNYASRPFAPPPRRPTDCLADQIVGISIHTY